MPGIAPGTATDIWARDQQQAYTLLFVFLNRAPEWIFLVVIRERLLGWWSEMKGIIGRTKFTKLGLTINDTIGNFSGGGLGNDSSNR